tara:strand:- start:3785 stop:4132 length:348 start_codon:yes stop_codon:yes gene_type:complete
MDNVHKLHVNKCDCFNCGISQELDEFDRDLSAKGDFSNDTGIILERIGQIAQSEYVSNKQRIKACEIMERHSATLRIIMDVLKDVYRAKYPEAVLSKSDQFIKYWTGKEAQSAFK